MKRSNFASIIHWIGFSITSFMLIMSFLDPSKDEIIIHFIASMLPNTMCWIASCVLVSPRSFFPFIKNNR